jgi:hypothetical protein
MTLLWVCRTGRESPQTALDTRLGICRGPIVVLIHSDEAYVCFTGHGEICMIISIDLIGYIR